MSVSSSILGNYCPSERGSLTHYNMLTMGQNLMRVDPYFESDDFVSYLPLPGLESR